jgi:hypothetical protein
MEISGSTKDNPKLNISNTKNDKNSNENLSESTILKSKEEITQIKNWISEKKNLNFKLLYKASIDGDSILKFHEKCDNKGPTLIIIKIKTGYRFGGYNPLSWNVQNNYKEDPLTFIFSLDKNKKYTIKENQVQYSSFMDVGCFAFGNGFDFVIKDNCTQNNFSYSETPYSYNTTEECELTGGERNFTVDDYEVYSVEFLGD